MLIYITCHITHSLVYFVQEKKAEKNTTKGWFPKEASTSAPLQSPTSSPTDNVGASAPPEEDIGPLSPPRVQKKAVGKKLTPKKRIGV
jgi:hypothetical protein